MTRLNWLFTFSSINVLLITLERYSFTTKVLLQPYSFLRLHEIIQITLLISLSVILPFLVLREISNKFSTVKEGWGLWFFIMFLLGIYFYASGNGLHEVASFTFNQYCNADHFSGQLCGSLFFNDYYTGNIYYFIGAILMFASGLFIEKKNPSKPYYGKNLIILLINSFIFALTFFAYAAFDRVLIGLFSVVILFLLTLPIFLSVRKNWRQHPYITYSASAYALATIASLIVRFH